MFNNIPIHLQPSIIERFRFENDPKSYLKVINKKTVNKFIWVKDKSKATYLNLQKEHLSIWSDLINDSRLDGNMAWNYNRITENGKYW